LYTTVAKKKAPSIARATLGLAFWKTRGMSEARKSAPVSDDIGVTGDLPYSAGQHHAAPYTGIGDVLKIV
jgi:hypothetical protein